MARVLRRCLICGKTDKVIDLEGNMKGKPYVCPICSARVKHEAQDAQKLPKPL